MNETLIWRRGRPTWILDYDIYMEQEANECGEQGANKGDTDVHVEQGVDEQESIQVLLLCSVTNKINRGIRLSNRRIRAAEHRRQETMEQRCIIILLHTTSSSVDIS